MRGLVSVVGVALMLAGLAMLTAGLQATPADNLEMGWDVDCTPSPCSATIIGDYFTVTDVHCTLNSCTGKVVPTPSPSSQVESYSGAAISLEGVIPFLIGLNLKPRMNPSRVLPVLMKKSSLGKKAEGRVAS